MKVISLLQPWATLVVIGAKRIETRSWNTKYRGDVLVHASANKKIAKEMIYQYPFNKVLTEYFNHVREPDLNDLPFGAIVGKTNIIHTVNSEQCFRGNEFEWQDLFSKTHNYKITDQEFAFGDYSTKRYGWLLDNSIQFANPVPAKGSLSLWDHPDIHEEEILCPECNYKQTASVEHTFPWFSYVHTCKKCGYTIMESEWNKSSTLNPVQL